jgi:hypothetical protein
MRMQHKMAVRLHILGLTTATVAFMAGTMITTVSEFYVWSTVSLQL